MIEDGDCFNKKLVSTPTGSTIEVQQNLFDVLNKSSNPAASSSSRNVERLVKRVLEQYNQKTNIQQIGSEHLALNTFLDISLFKERISFSSLNLEEESQEHLRFTPFSYMFSRKDPFLAFSEISCETNSSTESIHIPSACSTSSASHTLAHQYHRRNLKSSLLECRHCGDIFTSRVSFKIHQKSHLEDAKRRGVIEGQKLKNNIDADNIEDNDISVHDRDDADEDIIEDKITLHDPDYKVGDNTFCWVQNVKNVSKENQEIETYTVDLSSNLAKFSEKRKNIALSSNIEEVREKREGLHLKEVNAKKDKNNTINNRNGISYNTKDADIRSLNKLLKSNIKENAIQNVKALLAATKGDRRKRGKYIKYNQELRNEIAEFAEKQGASKTAKLYTEKLNFYVSESTVRNFIKSYSKIDRHWTELKDEIGQYANQFGIENCIQKYKSMMEYGNKSSPDISTRPKLTKETVRRFKAAFLSEKEHTHIYNMHCHADQNSSCTNETNGIIRFETDTSEVKRNTNCESTSPRFVCDDHLKLDIGKYAFYNGNTAAISHFSSKLQFNMKESTVRKFKRLWMKRKRITTEVSRSNSSLSTKDVKIKNSSKSLSKSLLTIHTPSSVSMTSLIMHNRENLSRQNEGNEPSVNKKEIRLQQIHSDCSLRQAMPVPCTSIASINGRRGPTSRTGCLSSLNKETKIQSTWNNDADYDNIPVSLIIKDKGRFKYKFLGCIPKKRSHTPRFISIKRV
jgi:hypothetical protein